MQALDVVLEEQNPGQADLTPTAGLSIERSRQVSHGDYACNLAMQLAKPLRKSPRDIAQALIAALPGSAVVEKVEIAGAGFINVFITTAAKQAVVKAV
ncbi:MAG: arginine--tRNA ligase, partial [Candidatus Ferrigenium altingense]